MATVPEPLPQGHIAEAGGFSIAHGHRGDAGNAELTISNRYLRVREYIGKGNAQSIPHYTAETPSPLPLLLPAFPLPIARLSDRRNRALGRLPERRYWTRWPRTLRLQRARRHHRPRRPFWLYESCQNNTPPPPHT